MHLEDSCGHAFANYVQVNTMLYVKMKGPGSLEIRTENTVKVATNLAMTPAQFYASKETFVANVAVVLGIDPSRIRIASVVAGRRLLQDASVQVLPPALCCSKAFYTHMLARSPCFLRYEGAKCLAAARSSTVN
jgi:hypothetical protein